MKPIGTLTVDGILYDIVEHDMRPEMTYLFYSHLDLIEQRVLIFYYGLFEEERPLSQKEVGNVMGIPRRKVSAIMSKARNRLRRQVCAHKHGKQILLQFPWIRYGRAGYSKPVESRG